MGQSPYGGDVRQRMLYFNLQCMLFALHLTNRALSVGDDLREGVLCGSYPFGELRERLALCLEGSAGFRDA